MPRAHPLKRFRPPLTVWIKLLIAYINLVIWGEGIDLLGKIES